MRTKVYTGQSVLEDVQGKHRQSIRGERPVTRQRQQLGLLYR